MPNGYITIPKFLTRREVADYLRVTEKTIDRLKAREEIPFYYVGRYIRFKASDVLNYLENVKAKPFGLKK
ncbi:helix-turn-helix domain-containing protein [Candidatus Parcubacteria bacterium]|nr:helix-turn-helix domain-containing protein [Candidatus Parcubacteria bacterium]